MMHAELIIFDCDGVLVDSETLSARVLRTMAAEIGVGMDHEESLDFLRGRKVATWVAELEGLARRQLDEDFIQDFRHRTANEFDQNLVAIPHVHAVISQLKAAYCTASSAPRQKICHTLELTGLLGLFEDRIYSAYEVGVWKPNPGLFLHAANDMGADPKDCVVIEDSLVGVQAGIEAGMNVLAYAPGKTAASLYEAGATTFKCMTELPALLVKWRPRSVASHAISPEKTTIQITTGGKKPNECTIGS